MKFEPGLSFGDPKAIDISWEESQRVGLLVSGGLDSAVLLAAMLFSAQRLGKKLDIRPFCIVKTDGSHTYLSAIFRYLSTKYRFELPELKAVGHGGLHHTLISKSALYEIFTKNLSDVVFLGSNKIPAVQLSGLAPVRIKAADPRIKNPFFDLYKTHILDLCVQLDDQKLFELTHTCTEQKIGSCYRCWQCNERAWAFKEMKIRDPQLQTAQSESSLS